MKCVILQPAYIPWRGFFHQIQKADVFVFYDDVQYDHHGWRNRNRIKTPRGPEWITIPLRSKGADWKKTTIREMEISWDKDWSESHFARLTQNYSNAPFFRRYQPLLERWYAARPELLADFTVEITIELAHELGIGHRDFVRSSTLGCTGAKTARLLKILQKLGARHYISGPSARAYIDEDLLKANGVTLEWMDYSYPEYPQLYPPFEPYVSILDLLMMTGPDAGNYIWATSAQR